MSNEAVRKRLAEFYATLDLACELPQLTTSGELAPFLRQQFGSEQQFWTLAGQLQNLGSRPIRQDDVIRQLADLVATDPRFFLILMHLHRQIRFTNLELVHLLFDASHLDDHRYYLKLMKEDPTFQELANQLQQNPRWTELLGPVEIRSATAATLASFKKVVAGYLSDEKSCWKRWESRIRNDPTVPRRIAAFVVKNEDFGQLVEENSIVQALQRSLRLVNVETRKKERGQYGERRVSEILKNAGFAYAPHSNAKTLDELKQKLRQPVLADAAGQYTYTCQKEWPAEDKRFDFVLIAKGKIQFVMEANFFTTAMSKIREVVRHYKDLQKACSRGGYRLIYITDGAGWLRLEKTVAKMIDLDNSIESPDQTPFLMNLRMLQDRMERIQQQMT